MVVHFRLLDEEKAMVASGFDKKNRRHRELLRSLIISCADISDQTKDWAMCRKVAVIVDLVVCILIRLQRRIT